MQLDDVLKVFTVNFESIDLTLNCEYRAESPAETCKQKYLYWTFRLFSKKTSAVQIFFIKFNDIFIYTKINLLPRETIRGVFLDVPKGNWAVAFVMNKKEKNSLWQENVSQQEKNVVASLGVLELLCEDSIIFNGNGIYLLGTFSVHYRGYPLNTCKTLHFTAYPTCA